MKTVVRLLIISCLVTLININETIAQDDTRNTIRIGYHSGQMFDDGNKPFENDLSGVYFGIARDIPFATIIHLNAGLEYFQTGSKSDDQNKIALSYISVPVGLKVKIGPVSAMGGASAGFRISTKETINGVESDPLINDYNRIDGTVYLGAGFKILALGVEIRYHWGFRDVFDQYKNQFLQIGANLHFGR